MLASVPPSATLAQRCYYAIAIIRLMLDFTLQVPDSDDRERIIFQRYDRNSGFSEHDIKLELRGKA